MTIPVIAIVGRPNVGKSTLFNRLTRSRNALVSDLPGMTRDRQYGEAEVEGRRFIVIDTGGITDDDNQIDQLTTSQALQAILDADMILFLVDARSGLVPADLAIAERLRSSTKKPLLVVVNKAEGLDTDIITADFFRLGLGTPIPIAAAHGSGVEDLITTLIPTPPPEKEAEEKIDRIKFAIVGRPNVGKSTLTNRILGEERVIVSDIPGTTRDSIAIPFERHGKKYTLIDTAGVRRRGKIYETAEKFSIVKTLQAIESSHVVLVLLDAKEGITDQDLHLIGFVLDSGKSFVIAYNKWDGLSVDTRDRAKSELDRRLDFIPNAKIHTISALHGTDVGNLFKSIDEAFTSAYKKHPTSVLTKILQEALLKHTPPLVNGRRIKMRYAHAGGHNPPTIIIHGNQVSSLPDSYRRYLAQVFQTKLKLVGTPVRIELKTSENPYRQKPRKMTAKELHKKQRLTRHSKTKGKKKTAKKPSKKNQK